MHTLKHLLLAKCDINITYSMQHALIILLESFLATITVGYFPLFCTIPCIIPACIKRKKVFISSCTHMMICSYSSFRHIHRGISTRGAFIIMPRCACASEVYGSVFVYVSVCLSVCVECYSCSRINEVQVRVMARFAYLECHGIVAFSDQCEAKLVHVVLLLYLAVSSALER